MQHQEKSFLVRTLEDLFHVFDSFLVADALAAAAASHAAIQPHVAGKYGWLGQILEESAVDGEKLVRLGYHASVRCVPASLVRDVVEQSWGRRAERWAEREIMWSWDPLWEILGAEESAAGSFFKKLNRETIRQSGTIAWLDHYPIASYKVRYFVDEDDAAAHLELILSLTSDGVGQNPCRWVEFAIDVHMLAGDHGLEDHHTLLDPGSGEPLSRPGRGAAGAGVADPPETHESE